jgi:hypothetical protein
MYKGDRREMRQILGIALLFVIGFSHDAVRADAVRSVIVVFLNGTGSPLKLVDKELAHGIWTPNWLPPDTIPVGATAQWRSESNGVATGTEGEAAYEIQGQAGKFTFRWNNPFIGANTYSLTVPDGFKGEKTSGGEGNRTIAQFYAGRPGQEPPCNATWVLTQLRQQSNDALTDFQKSSAAFSTPFKSAGFSGWVTTGCGASGVGSLVRNAQKSTDGFTTVDVKLESLTVGSASGGSGKFLRLEIRPGVALPAQPMNAGVRLRFSGPVLIDMDLQSGGLLIVGSSRVTAGWPELHPTAVSIVL